MRVTVRWGHITGGDGVFYGVLINRLNKVARTCFYHIRRLYIKCDNFSDRMLRLNSLYVTGVQ